MSRHCDEYYSVYHEARTRAAKSHKCSACGETIEPGYFYYRVTWIFEGSADGVKRCLRCQALHVHLRRMSSKHADGELWPDENLNCGDSYEDTWGAAPPEEIARLALLTPAEAQDVLDVKATERRETL